MIKLINNRRRAAMVLTAAALTVLLIITQTGCSSQSSEPVSRTEDDCLNTTCEIDIYNMDESDANDMLTLAFADIDDMENLLSSTIEGSDVYKINHADGEYVEVSDDTLKVIKLAMEMGDMSGGKFDVTLGKISEMWDFNGDPKVPDDGDIQDALEHTGYENIEIDGNKVRLKDPGAHMDLGGIAKGYIADKVTTLLEDNGVESAIINLGGNVVAVGSKAEDTPFVIGVERPYTDRTEIVGSVEVSDKTLVTSGIYERYFEQDGVNYHHVLDPATGYPAETDLEAVTIVADAGNSALCDGMSTTCLILGEDGAKEFVARMQKKYPGKHIQASFINKDDEVTTTKGMNLTLTED